MIDLIVAFGSMVIVGGLYWAYLLWKTDWRARP